MKNRWAISILFTVAAGLALISLGITYYTTGKIDWLRLLTVLFSSGLAYIVSKRR
ncbi:hypothetical protein GU926_12085 [Nibribacter ruber]|uniref:Uncharacterized protein n=1 Tax=Nibribacter ruber TaxID=2698458 RepID=A0A6P1P111_9BACT|nr:hypothetical protein [Nibribacter ruber]QHL88131.1 hypothetical protein GU926_12085 [Nibribacter ruber]